MVWSGDSELRMAAVAQVRHHWRGQEGDVEREGETCVGSEILSRQNLRCVCWRELGREKKKLPMGFPGFLGCPFDWTALPFTEIEDGGTGYMEGQGPCVQVWIHLSF